MSKRYTHRDWSTFEPGESIIGYLEKVRTVTKPDGSTYPILELRDVFTGLLTGLTAPTMLRGQMAGVPLESAVRVTYLGTVTTRNGHRMMKFDVQTWPPIPGDREEETHHEDPGRQTP